MPKQTSISGKDLYFVAVKVFLRDKAGRLYITKDKFNCWDIPGGRLKYDDFNKTLEKVVARKMKEELGFATKYKLGTPVVFMRHERGEILPDGNRTKVRIFAIGYEAQYLGGKIQLGKNHTKGEWVDLGQFNPARYFTGGWLKGVKEYIGLYK